ncbi:nucleoside-diphosphate sugar epimerase/dehydratase [Sphingomonas sp. HF-S4]|uniref:Nucleoside-diphosphate sugar epimerase/dehydratase n=1 Tax=Sphingomonas agrestis TaxID=3080540 RepID=A0ABU3YBD3_9SPHN|nr:nucleoside-diphosphate sugar epimerase/dehydratase [Sphingomonas sp. HF-S4]MDV3458452.1 nucleoside-diphosphate sugar epimerase/dehydratase [Sphingomonas sp. HF-S4]
MVESIVTPLLALPRVLKRVISIVVDTAFCTLAVWLAYYLRLGEFVTLAGRPTVAVIASVCLAIPMFVVFGLYRAVLRYAGQGIIWATIGACASYGIVYASIFSMYGVESIPRTVGIIQPLLLFALVFLSRTGASYWLGGAYRKLSRPAPSDRTLIYGAGMSGQQLAAAITDAGSMKVVGFLDDNRSLHGRTVGGVRVYDPCALDTILTRFDIHHVLLAIPSASRKRRNDIIAELREAQVEVRTLPGVLDLANGTVKIDDLRPLSIDDLLSREPVPPESERLSRKVSGQVVLVTGAGGSIGSELTRQVMALNPSRLLLIETSEYALYSIHRELEDLNSAGCELVPLLGSVTDRERMAEIFRTWRPQQVYHAAAFKHVPLVEHNIVEGVRNNALGTLVVAQLALEYGVDNFVLVSTDKAVRPSNTMGASKRLAELILQGLASTGPQTCFSMVRFGNVLGSSGSVVPLFREQIRNGGPVTITHVEMTRYFMTIPEAAQLVMQAGAMAQGGEVFVLDMGEPVRILDLARNMIELSGLTVSDAEGGGGDIQIRAIGLRPGEKLYEELLIGNDPQPTEHPRIMMATEKCMSWPVLQEHLDSMSGHIAAHDVVEIRRLLLQLVEEFTPSDGLVDWIHLAADLRQGKE